MYNKNHVLHKLKSKPHPESPERVESILEHLKSSQFKKNIFTY